MALAIELERSIRVAMAPTPQSAGQRHLALMAQAHKASILGARHSSASDNQLTGGRQQPAPSFQTSASRAPLSGGGATRNHCEPPEPAASNHSLVQDHQASFAPTSSLSEAGPSSSTSTSTSERSANASGHRLNYVIGDTPREHSITKQHIVPNPIARAAQLRQQASQPAPTAHHHQRQAQPSSRQVANSLAARPSWKSSTSALGGGARSAIDCKTPATLLSSCAGARYHHRPARRSSAAPSLPNSNAAKPTTLRSPAADATPTRPTPHQQARSVTPRGRAPLAPTSPSPALTLAGAPTLASPAATHRAAGSRSLLLINGDRGSSSSSSSSAANKLQQQVSVNTSISRLRQGALLARRQSRQLIASTNAINSTAATATTTSRRQQPMIDTARGPSMQLTSSNSKLSTSNRIRHLARASSVSVSSICLNTFTRIINQQSPAPGRDPSRQPISCRSKSNANKLIADHRKSTTVEHRNTCHKHSTTSSLSRLASGKTSAKFSLASSTSSLSLATVKRPRQATSAKGSSPVSSWPLEPTNKSNHIDCGENSANNQALDLLTVSASECLQEHGPADCSQPRTVVRDNAGTGLHLGADERAQRTPANQNVQIANEQTMASDSGADAANTSDHIPNGDQINGLLAAPNTINNNNICNHNNQTLAEDKQSLLFNCRPISNNRATIKNMRTALIKLDIGQRPCLTELVDNIKSPTEVTFQEQPCHKSQSLLFNPPDQANLLVSPTDIGAGSAKQQLAQKTIDIPTKSELINDFYDLEARPFARGKFAQVKRCISKGTKQCFAAKCIKKRRRLVDIRHEILLEIEALKLSYYTEHIVKLFEVYETPNEMILVLEMANGGELQRVLDDEEFIEEAIVQKMVRQILEGLIYLHDNEIAHLDIKPQNLLLTDPFPNGDIKLCDFGISRRITKDCEIREICGTPDYVAPEILRYDPISLATDMWSLGVLTYVLLSGYSPFGSDNKQQTFCNITQAALDFPMEIFGKISNDAIDFMKNLIVREPSGRLTSRQARQHHWINDRH